MYFESRMKKRHGLPWMGGLSNADKASNEYFEELEKLAEQVDDVEDETGFISSLSSDEFGSGYSFVAARITELKKYLIHDAVIVDKYGALRSLNEIKRELAELKDQAVLYDDEFGDIGFYDDSSFGTDYDEDEDDEDEDEYDSDYEDEDFDDDDYGFDDDDDDYGFDDDDDDYGFDDDDDDDDYSFGRY